MCSVGRAFRTSVRERERQRPGEGLGTSGCAAEGKWRLAELEGKWRLARVRLRRRRLV